MGEMAAMTGLWEEADKQETVRWNSGQLARHSLGNQYYITLFTRLPSQLSFLTTVSFSPSRIGFINNLFLNVLFFFFCICSMALNDNPPSKRKQQITLLWCYVVWYCLCCRQTIWDYIHNAFFSSCIKQNLRTMLFCVSLCERCVPYYTSTLH